MKVLAVTVTFHPDLKVLRQQLDVLLTSLGSDPILLVDNGSPPETLSVLQHWTLQDPRITVQALGENRGLAAAHNVGIAAARAQGRSHVLLMDQDSLPAPDMVEELIKAFALRLTFQPHLAAVGPCYTDPVLRNPPDFVRLHWWGVSRFKETLEHPVVEVDYLISSGCLISLAALAVIGPMQEALFIDYVDIEWGLRARRLGYTLCGVFPAHMTHALGPVSVHFLWRRFPLHSPKRHYFVVRNALWLYRDKALPLLWRMPHALRLLLRFAVYFIAGSSRRERLKFVWMGVQDGLQGRMGKPSWMN